VEGPNLGIARELYGFNWAAVSGRERGLGRMAEVVDPEFEAHLSAELGGRVVRGIDELRQFGYALEEDFAELTYDAEDFRELGHDRVIVLGTIHGRGRVSGMPVRGKFGHVWTFAGGRPRAIHAFLSHEGALEAADAGSAERSEADG
jgi:ketosteroid isomerase-like protein